MEKLRRNASSWHQIYNIIHDKVHFAWKNTYMFFDISPAECELLLHFFYACRCTERR